MPRPQDKQTLLALGQANFDKLMTLVQEFTDEELHAEFQFETRDRNVRDTLVHLHEWHLMMMEWYRVGMGGAKPEMPAPGYTWKTLPDLNLEIWKKYQQTSLNEGMALLKQSFQQIRKLIEKQNDPELFEKKRYPWTGTTSLGSYFVSATSSHYDWALKQLKKHKRTYGG